jgi:hypothetical protein
MTKIRQTQLVGIVAIAGSFAVANTYTTDLITSNVKTAPSRYVVQDDFAKRRATAKEILPLVVDGRKTPDQISDEMAYRHFIQWTLVKERPSAQEVTMQQHRLTSVGLSRADLQAYLSSIKITQSRLGAIATQRIKWSMAVESAPSETAAALKTLRDDESQIFEDTRQRLRGALTADGSLRLDSFISNRIKPRVKVFGSLPE